MLGQHPTCHSQRDLQLEICSYVLGALGRKRKKLKILKKKKKKEERVSVAITVNSIKLVGSLHLVVDGDHAIVHRVATQKYDQCKDPHIRHIFFFPTVKISQSDVGSSCSVFVRHLRPKTAELLE